MGEDGMLAEYLRNIYVFLNKVCYLGYKIIFFYNCHEAELNSALGYVVIFYIAHTMIHRNYNNSPCSSAYYI